MLLAAAEPTNVFRCALYPALYYNNHAVVQDRLYVDDNQANLNQFLARVERPAFRMAETATRNRDDALDIVQDSMIKLVEKYARKPSSEWQPLFYRILQSRIVDHYRRNAVQKRLFRWMGFDSEPLNEPEITAVDPFGPADLLDEQLTWSALQAGLRALPLRQQQVFLLRAWQGLSVEETSRIMKCSQGSVKTHFSRATHALKKSMNINNQEQNDDQP